MPRPQLPVNALEIFKSAESYFKLSNEGIKTKENNAFTMSLNEAIVATHAFACELYMKCIYAVENKLTFDSHSLSKIFLELHPDTRKRIEDIYNQIRPQKPSDFDRFFGIDCDLQTAMDSPKDAYKLFRYSFEPTKKGNENLAYRLNNVLIALRKYIVESQPDWPLLNGPS